jgi:RNA polymerase sigma-B factor
LQSGLDYEGIEVVARSGQVSDAVSRERLIASHLPLVRSIARRHVGKGEELDDLVQVGAVGLLKASDRFDATRGVGFAAFASPVIEGEIRHHLRDRTSPVRIPRGLDRVRKDLRRRGGELESELGRPPTVPELATALGLQQSDIEGALTAEKARSSVAISSEAHQDPRSPGASAPASTEDRLLLAASMRSLSERERRIVLLRFHADMTERQIAREVGLSQAQVSRLLKGALAKLRDELASPTASANASGTTSDTKPKNPKAAGTSTISSVGTPSTGVQASSLTLPEYLDLPYRLEVTPERDGERSWWTASVDELSGCVARGDTADEAVTNLRPAMKSWFTAALAEHRAIPLPSKRAGSRSADSYSGRFLVRMPKTLHAQLAQAAEARQVSLNRLVTDLLSAAVEPGDSGEPTAASLRPDVGGDVATGSARAAPRSIRVALATNLAVVILAGIVAIVLLVLAIAHGI